MDVRLSQEQQALRDSAAQVVDRLAPRAVGQIGDAARMATLDAAVAASGWWELRTAVDGGDSLASGVEPAVVAEELGRGLADTPFLGPTLAAELRRLAGAAPGDVTETVALDPALSSLARAFDGTSPAAVAIDARGSAQALLLVPDGECHRLARVELPAAPGGLDLTRPSVVLDPSSDVVLVDEPAGPITADDLARWTALGLALTCADLVGIMRGAVDLASAYATERRQYGAAIGSFQAVQHMLADAFVAMEGSRSITLHAAWAVDALAAPEALTAATLAKAYCARAATSVCETAIQVHGGIGNTWECLAHVYLRRSLLSSDVLGNAGASLMHVLVHHDLEAADGLR
ncbi:MAG: acyl-CoA dehydrogenase family protein [Acidimicrobiales bacterium]|jgi:alkylation response protein AidB-like acyl-CoA dehydrogenase